jgi:hypothetical protein
VTAVPRDGPASPDDGGAGGLSAAQYDSFVVRVLSRPHERQVVGGQVTHIATRRTLRFTDLQRVMAFMLAQLGRHSVSTEPGTAEPISLDDGLAWDDLPNELR